MTNVRDFIINLIDDAQHGVVVNAVIMESLKAYTDNVIKTGEPTDDNNKSLINPRLWFYACKEVRDKINDYENL